MKRFEKKTRFCAKGAKKNYLFFEKKNAEIEHMTQSHRHENVKKRFCIISCQKNESSSRLFFPKITKKHVQLKRIDRRFGGNEHSRPQTIAERKRRRGGYRIYFVKNAVKSQTLCHNQYRQ
jgi:hypothetical protein